MELRIERVSEERKVYSEIADRLSDLACFFAALRCRSGHVKSILGETTATIMRHFGDTKQREEYKYGQRFKKWFKDPDVKLTGTVILDSVSMPDEVMVINSYANVKPWVDKLYNKPEELEQHLGNTRAIRVPRIDDVIDHNI